MNARRKSAGLPLGGAADRGNAEPSAGSEGVRPDLVELLDYTADLVLELVRLADQCNCGTLAGILALAHAEASRQSETAKKQRRS